MKFNLNKESRQYTYYYSQNGTTLGPFTLSQLLKKIDGNSLVYREGINWTNAKDVDELSKYFKTQTQENLIIGSFGSLSSSAKKLFEDLKKIENYELNKSISFKEKLIHGNNIMIQKRMVIAQKQSSLISSFPISNRKEDLLEIISMAIAESSKSIHNNGFWINDGSDIIKNAWITKGEQAIIKAKFLFRDDASTMEFLNDYHSKLENSKKSQKKKSNTTKKFSLGISLFLISIFLFYFGLNMDEVDFRKIKDLLKLDQKEQEVDDENISNGIDNELKLTREPEQKFNEESANIENEIPINIEKEYLITLNSAGLFEIGGPWKTNSTNVYNYEYILGYGTCTDQCCNGGINLGFNLIKNEFGIVENPEIIIGAEVYEINESLSIDQINNEAFFMTSDYCEGWYFNDKINFLIILSEEFKTTEGIGVGTTLNYLEGKFGELKFYVGFIEEDENALKVAIEKYPNISFVLDVNDYSGNWAEISFLENDNWLKISDFKNETKIKKIIINRRD
jgi:hypothetical protein